MRSIIVLSLFDGMGCFRIALSKLKVKVSAYYASEIDKPAMHESTRNFSDIIQIGDVTKVKIRGSVSASEQTKLESQGFVFVPVPDILGGGSPCTGFSLAGKGLNFDDPQSKLFFEYVRIREECRKLNPKVLFLLENVPMKYEHELVISRYMGIDPIEINAALVSAQNRLRLFWTNINEKPYGLFGELRPDIPQPKDRGILLKHILEPNVAKKYYMTAEAVKTMLGRSDGGINKAGEDSPIVKIGKNGKLKSNQDKAGTLCGGGHSGGNHSDMDLLVEFAKAENVDKSPKELDTTPRCARMVGRNPENPKSRKGGEYTEQMIEPRLDEKSGTLTTVTKDNLLLQVVLGEENVNIPSDETTGACADGNDTNPCMLQRPHGYNDGGEKAIDGKTPSLTSNSWQHNNFVLEGDRGAKPNGNQIEQLNPSKESGGKQPYQQHRIYGVQGKSPAHNAQLSTGSYAIMEPSEIDDLEKRSDIRNQNEKSIPTSQHERRIRRLTPIECERLQCVPDNFTSGVSDSQRYKMLGNGWPVDVIVHILSFADLPVEN